VWAASEALRLQLLLLTICIAAIGGFEALLFNTHGRLVDWLGKTETATLRRTQR
jgi:hypothetical protein